MSTEDKVLKKGTKIFIQDEKEPVTLDEDWTQEEFLDWLRGDDTAFSEVSEDNLEHRPDGSIAVKKQKFMDLGLSRK